MLVATALTHLSLQRFPIRLDLSIPCPEGWAKALSEQQSLHLYNSYDENRECRYLFTMALLDHGCYAIQDETDHTLLYLPTSSLESNDAALGLETIKHLAKFKLIKTLTNNSLDNSTTRFRNSFSAQLIIKSTGERINPGYLQRGKYEPTYSHPECLLEVDDGTFLQLEVTNNEENSEEEGGYALYLHVYSMSSS
jgi:hypothetical protein